MRVAAAALLVLSTAAWPQPASPVRPSATEQTIPVTRGGRLAVSNYAGSVVIRGWPQDAVRVRASHMPRTRVSIASSSSLLAVSASGMQGPASAVDYEIAVPPWMPIHVDCTYANVSIEGTRGGIVVENVRGDIAIKGGEGLSVKSIDGQIAIDGSKGRVTASAVNRGIRISGASGDVAAETTNGSITLSGLSSENVDVGSVNGSLTYEGTPAETGKYRFSTHNGGIVVAVPDTASATFNVRTYQGSMQTNLPLRGSGDVRRGRRAAFTLGGGAAQFEVESFGGTVHLRRAGTLSHSENQGAFMDRPFRRTRGNGNGGWNTPRP